MSKPKKKTPAGAKVTVQTYVRKFDAKKLPPRRPNGKWKQKAQQKLF